LLDGLLDELLDERLISDVAKHFQDSARVQSGLEAELVCFLKSFCISACDREFGASLSEELRRCSTDAIRRTGNNNDFSGEERLCHATR
ncbi:hypothetical protein PMAYCL1PPCAC_16930, partial [Pristionchus mayeri]